MRASRDGTRYLSMIALTLVNCAPLPVWADEPSRPGSQGEVRERGLTDRSSIQGMRPAEPGPGDVLKGTTLTRGFKRYWIDRLETTPEVFPMGQALQSARIVYHCQPACLDVDRVSDVAFEIHHRRGPDVGLLIAFDRPRTLVPDGSGCPPGQAIPNASCVTLSIARSFVTAPGVFEVSIVKGQDRIRRLFPIVPEGNRFRVGGQ